MKKLLLGLLVLGSISSFGSEITLKNGSSITLSHLQADDPITVSCGDRSDLPTCQIEIITSTSQIIRFENGNERSSYVSFDKEDYPDLNNEAFSKVVKVSLADLNDAGKCIAIGKH